MTPKKRYTFMIDPELADGLKRLKERDGASEGESMRRALAAYLKGKRVTVKAPRPRVRARDRG